MLEKVDLPHPLCVPRGPVNPIAPHANPGTENETIRTTPRHSPPLISFYKPYPRR